MLFEVLPEEHSVHEIQYLPVKIQTRKYNLELNNLQLETDCHKMIHFGLQTIIELYKCNLT